MHVDENLNNLHYRPFDGWFGDPNPFYWKGVYHIFYDKLQSNGILCWAHISSTDLVNWEEHPDAIPNGKNGEPDCNGCLTGSIIERGGCFYAFYTGNGPECSSICLSRSHDLVNWNKENANPVILPDKEIYAGNEAWRDPCVFWNPDANCYWMVFCSRTHGNAENPYTGCLGLATSSDLVTWTIQPPIWTPGDSTVVECPDLFQYDKKWILGYFWHETRFRTSDSPAGPWHRPAIQAPDSFDFFSGKSMWDGRRRIMIGWIPRRDCDCGPRIWGGNMLLPREFYLLPDGTPATRLPDEIRTHYRMKSNKSYPADVFKPLTGKWKVTADALVSAPTTGIAHLAYWKNAPADLYVSADLEFCASSSVSILLRCTTDDTAFWPDQTPLDHGYALHIDPLENRITLRKAYQWDQCSDILSTYHKMTDHNLSIEMFLHGDILEVFLDGRRTIVSRLLDNPRGSLAFISRDGRVRICNIRLKEI